MGVRLLTTAMPIFKSHPSNPHQGGIKFKPELRVRNQDYGGMKVEHFVVEKR